jgi:hypothetical protein
MPPPAKSTRKPAPESQLSLRSQSNTLQGSFKGPTWDPNTLTARGSGSASAMKELVMEELTYFESLVNPEGNVGAKVPDNLNMNTATYQSVLTIPVYGNTAAGTGATDKGRFWFAVQPCITDQNAFNATNQNATAIYQNPAVTWATPFTAGQQLTYNDLNVTTLVPNRSVPRTGLMMRARPVSMSVWFQYNADLINNGGEVAAALVTGDTYADNITIASGTNYMRWENLADHPEAFQGALCNGTYTWWRPEGPGDLEFRPVEANGKTRALYQYDFPTVFVAGQSNHPGDATANQPVGRIRVIINYEYITDSRVVASCPSPVSPMGMALAAKLTSGLPTSMANETHDSWIGQVIKYGVAGVAGFFLGGGPLGAAAAVLGVMGLTRAS